MLRRPLVAGTRRMPTTTWDSRVSDPAGEGTSKSDRPRVPRPYTIPCKCSRRLARLDSQEADPRMREHPEQVGCGLGTALACGRGLVAPAWKGQRLVIGRRVSGSGVVGEVHHVQVDFVTMHF